jgi:hypothetical protein
MLPRATVCSDTVVSAPASAPNAEPTCDLEFMSHDCLYVPSQNAVNIHPPGAPAGVGRVISGKDKCGLVTTGADQKSGFALTGHGSGCSFGCGLGIAQIVVANGLEVLVQLVHQGMPLGMFRPTMSWSEMPSRYLIRARIELPCAAISTRLPALMLGAMLSFQAGSTRATVSFRHSVKRHGFRAGVAAVAALAAGVGRFQRRWRRVVAAAPDQHLLVAVLFGHVGLVQALQAAVVAFVQAVSP